MPKKTLFTPDGYYSFSSVRDELIELKNSQGTRVFKDFSNIDAVMSAFWFKDREYAFILQTKVYKYFKYYLKKNLTNFNRFQFYKDYYKNYLTNKNLINFAWDVELGCKNEFTREELQELTTKHELEISWLVKINFFTEVKDTNSYVTIHHTITEFFSAYKIFKEHKLDSFQNDSSILLHSSKTFFNPSWYGVAQFLFDTNLQLNLLDFFIKLGEDNPENIDEAYSNHLARVKFQKDDDPRKEILFTLIYNHTKESNRWIPIWTEEGMVNLYNPKLYDLLSSDLVENPTSLYDTVRTSNAVSILGSLIQNQKITDQKTLTILKDKFINYCNQQTDSNVLQRESYTALIGFKDPSVISRLYSTFQNLSNNSSDQLVKEAFLNLCYSVAPNNPQTIDIFLNTMPGSAGWIAWQGLKAVTDPESLFYLLETISKSSHILNQIKHDESIYFKSDPEETNPLQENLRRLSQIYTERFLLVTQRLAYLACSLPEFFTFDESYFLDFIFNLAVVQNPFFITKILEERPSDWDKHTTDNLIDFSFKYLNSENYHQFCTLVISTDSAHRPRLYLIKSEEIRKKVAKIYNIDIIPTPDTPAFLQTDTSKDEFYQCLYLDPNNPEVYRTDLYDYFLRYKDELLKLPKKDLDHLLYLAFDKGLKLIDPAKFQINITKYTDGKQFNWSTQAQFFGGMIQTIKVLKPKFDFRPYKTKLINYIPFCFSDDFAFILEVLDNLDQSDIDLLNSLFGKEAGDRRYLNPENYCRFVKEKGIGLKGIKEILLSYLDDDKIEDYPKISAIELLPQFTNKTNKKVRKILKNIEKGEGSISSSATCSLIKIYKDKDSINKRFDSIKALKILKRVRESGIVYSLDEEEVEYSSGYLPQILIETKDTKLADNFMKLVKDALSVQDKPEYKDYVEYINRSTTAYLESIASQSNFHILEELEKEVGNQSMWWNYMIPQLKITFLRGVNVTENINPKEKPNIEIKPDVIAEDKYIELYKLAWLKIYTKTITTNINKNFSEQCEFNIVSGNGCEQSFRTLTNIPAGIIHNKQIWLFDFDQAYDKFNGLNHSKWNSAEGSEHNGIFRKMQEQEKSVYALLLPIPTHRKTYASLTLGSKSRMEIELYFENESLLKDLNKIHEEEFPGENNISKVYSIISNDKICYKSSFYKPYESDPNYIFRHFELLFRRIYQLLDIKRNPIITSDYLSTDKTKETT